MISQTRQSFRRWIALLVALGSGLVVSELTAVWAQDSGDVDITIEDITLDVRSPEFFAEYDRVLQAVLKTRRDEEKVFVNQVVEYVRLNRLPKKLVDASFLWVRQNRPTTRYPFVYFERVLRLQAERLHLKVPDFDRSIYSTR